MAWPTHSSRGDRECCRFMWDAEQPSAREVLYILHGLESVQQAGEERLGVPQLVSEALSERVFIQAAVM